MIALQRIRSLGQDWTISAMNWIDDHVTHPADYPSFRFSFGWWLDRQLSRLFGFFYTGSDEEIMSALQGETPRKAMSQRQREFAHVVVQEELKWSCFFDEFFCADCDRELLVIDEVNLCAGCRALHPEMLLEDRK
jgi:hypothetical protein